MSFASHSKDFAIKTPSLMVKGMWSQNRIVIVRSERVKVTFDE
jgi:hypothetical protein